MKKNVLFSPLFLYNLALITHDATMSVDRFESLSHLPGYALVTSGGTTQNYKSSLETNPLLYSTTTAYASHWVIPEKIHTPPTDGVVF